jgi:catechol 2,3-dioxygenase-like lactoylglutathione lyase family enzyme
VIILSSIRTRALIAALTVCVACRSSPHSRPSPEAAGAIAAHLPRRSSQFLAVSVVDLEASSRWYQSTFGLRTVLDNTSADGSVRTVVLESHALIVELSAHRAARSLRDYAGRPTPTFLVHGFFKGGLFVSDLDRAAAVLRSRGEESLSPIREDSTSGLRFVLLRDPDGNFLQLLERGRRP